MSELSTNLYILGRNSELSVELGKIFKTINDAGNFSSENLSYEIEKKVSTLFPDKGLALFRSFATSISNEGCSLHEALVAESRHEIEHGCCLHFVHSASGVFFINAIVKFIGSLSADIDVRACLLGDDDPWEIFYRYQDGEVVEEYCMPDHEEWEDGDFPPVYCWWHEGLPESIKEGFINFWLESDEEE